MGYKHLSLAERYYIQIERKLGKSCLKLVDGEFELSIGRVCEVIAIAARNEALELGQFRSGRMTIVGT